VFGLVYACQHRVFGFLNAVIVTVCTQMVKSVPEMVVQQTLKMPWKEHLLGKPRHGVVSSRFKTNNDDNSQRTAKTQTNLLAELVASVTVPNEQSHDRNI